MNKAARVQAFSDFLKEEGYAPKIDKDGDILFKVEGKSYLVILDENDLEFFRLIFPKFWSIDSDEERAKVEQAALRATSGTKVAKVFPVQDDTWASVELFTSSIEEAIRVFPRSLHALQTAVNTFAGQLRG